MLQRRCPCACRVRLQHLSDVSQFDEHRDPRRLHEPFLERAAKADDGEAGHGAHALAAFLVMRLVDTFALDSHPVSLDARTYQVNSTHDFVSALSPQTVEIGHLLEITRLAQLALTRGEPRVLCAPTLAFARYLEDERRLPEAIDALETAGRLLRGPPGEEEVATLLQLGRVARKLNRHAYAMDAYRAASRIAGRLGDRHSVFLGRIGRGIVLQRTGKLPESRRVLRAVIREAARGGDTDAEARANHDLGITLLTMNLPAEAAAAAFRAYELYEGPEQRVRALYDLGVALLEFGSSAGAQDALCMIVETASRPEPQADAMIVLLHVAVQNGDRITFERWRRSLEALRSTLPPDGDVEISINVGLGLADFGEAAGARKAWQEAAALARTYDLEAKALDAESLLAHGSLPDRAVEPDTRRRRAQRAAARALEIAGRLHELRMAGGVSAE